MNIESLQLFVDVARTGSFAKAAAVHRLDPSVASRRISKLERDLGFRLFQRTTRTIALTEVGTEFFSRIEPHLIAIHEAQQAARDLVAQPIGVLRVTASTSFGYEILSPLLPEFLASAPRLRVELMLTDRRINLIEEGIDVAIRLGELPDSEFVATKIMPITFRLYGREKWSDASGVPEQLECVTYTGAAEAVRLRSPVGSIHDVKVNSRLAVSNALAMKRCVTMGVAPGLLPNWLVKSELADGTLVDLFPGYEYRSEPDRAAWFVYPTRLYVPSKVRAFIEFVTKRLSP